MESERKAFSFYRSYYEASKDLPTKEDQADFLMAICSYIFDGVEPEITGVASAMFKLAKPNLDTSIKRASVGQTGGKSKANAKQNDSKPEANAKQNGSKPEANDKQTASNDEANPKRYMINDYMINDYMINDQVINDKEKINKKEKQRTTSAVAVAKKLISDFAGDDKDLEAALNDFLSMRKKIKKPMTDRALQQRLKKLQELSGGDQQKAAAIVDQTVNHCWQDFYPLKDGNDKNMTAQETDDKATEILESGEIDGIFD